LKHGHVNRILSKIDSLAFHTSQCCQYDQRATIALLSFLPKGSGISPPDGPVIPAGTGLAIIDQVNTFYDVAFKSLSSSLQKVAAHFSFSYN
jgi:hypothetical protein